MLQRHSPSLLSLGTSDRRSCCGMMKEGRASKVRRGDDGGCLSRPAMRRDPVQLSSAVIPWGPLRFGLGLDGNGSPYILLCLALCTDTASSSSVWQ